MSLGLVGGENKCYVGLDWNEEMSVCTNRGRSEDVKRKKDCVLVKSEEVKEDIVVCECVCVRMDRD